MDLEVGGNLARSANSCPVGFLYSSSLGSTFSMTIVVQGYQYLGLQGFATNSYRLYSITSFPGILCATHCLLLTVASFIGLCFWEAFTDRLNQNKSPKIRVPNFYSPPVMKDNPELVNICIPLSLQDQSTLGICTSNSPLLACLPKESAQREQVGVVWFNLWYIHT